eukprot:TRINITY_DN2462_c0_g1_i1.p2 TRINITY_DN2462_c0_g1~~TRINITY_DN2462_c0_g1_i1.p2  ORF type:complete len:396 (+),score=69.22 TRINITY_DN2462_c0_g1_i1:30-1217(+)
MRSLCTFATVLLCSVLVAASAQPMYGVNLGGWLVLESWITPSLYSNNSVAAGLGEWEFCAQLGPAKAQQALTQHWDTWVSQSEIQELAAAGVTHVRIPIGYWILGDLEGGEPFVVGGWPFLVRVLQWCKQAGLLALIDLHGAPGSQNGHDNSGRVGPIDWPQPHNINRTLFYLAEIAQRSIALNAQSDTLNVIFGIEFLNEPWSTHVGGPIEMPFLLDFYQKAYHTVRGAGWSGDLWMHDGFAYTDPIWKGFMPPPDYQNVYIDTHIYHCFGGPYASLSPWDNVHYTCTTDRQMIAAHTWADWTITGEWSMALDRATPSDVWRSVFFDAQVSAYAPRSGGGPGKGEFFWNFKIETGFDEWNYLLGVRQGYITNHVSKPDDFTYDCAAAYPEKMYF